jgi:formiminotetrahydrofolate cyclodeaminase
MNYADGSFKKYLDDAAAKLPAPGGGSVAAAIGALGASMSAMVANFTLGNKKYADVEQEIRGILDRVESQRRRLTELMDADVAAYAKVSAAYSMSKGTDDEKRKRSAAISEACRSAMAVPMEVARCSMEIARVCDRLVEIGNRNLITDVGVSVLAADAAVKAAALNVEINLGSIGDEKLSMTAKNELGSMTEESDTITERVMAGVRACLR